MAQSHQLFDPVGIDPVGIRVGIPGVDGIPIDLDDGRQIMDAFHPPFDFQRMNPGADQLRKMLDHAEIPGIEDIRSPLVFENRHELAGTHCLDNRILPPAGMTAHPAVAVPQSHETAQQTSARIGNAHSPVNEALHFHTGFPNNFGNLGQRKFSGRIDPDSPHVFPESGTGRVGDIGLGADMNGYVGNQAPGHPEDSRIGHDDGIRPHPPDIAKIVGNGRHFMIAGINVAGHIDFFSAIMDKANGRCQFRKSEIPGKIAQAEILAGQIHSIGPVMQGDFKLFEIACRCQQLNFIWWVGFRHDYLKKNIHRKDAKGAKNNCRKRRCSFAFFAPLR